MWTCISIEKHTLLKFKNYEVNCLFLLFIIFETYALDGYSQNQKVTMNKGTAAFAEIIRQIENKQTICFTVEHEIALDKQIAVSTREPRLPKFLIEFCKEQVSRIRWKATIFW